MALLLLVATVAWLSLLFGLARLTDARPAWARASTAPLVHAASLGVYATSWTYFGAAGVARTQGLTFLAVSLGPTLACLLIPAVWLPLLGVLRRHQLSTVADLFAFRYRSPALGVAVTAAMVVGIVPYLAVQVRAVAQSAASLGLGLDARAVAAAFCVVMVGFAAQFGARHATRRERHAGLVAAVAFESLFKTAALLAVGVAAAVWLVRNPQGGGDDEMLQQLADPARSPNFVSTLLLSVGATFLLPRQFHMAFAEAPDGEAGERALRTTAWAFPALLLVMNLPVPLIMLAGARIAPAGNADLSVLAVAAGSPWLSAFAWLGGVSAASAMVIVSGLALSSMVLTHLVLPLQGPPAGDVAAKLLRTRRLVLAVMLGLAFAAYLVLEAAAAGPPRGGALARVGLVSFSAVANLVPGVAGVLFFPRATRAGVLAGLLAGLAVWVVLLALPLSGVALVEVPARLHGGDPLGFASLLAVSLNALVVWVVSAAVAQQPDEATAAALCRSEVVPATTVPHDVAGLQRRLVPILGRAGAEVEVKQVLQELGLQAGEARPAQLRRLADRLEANLTGLMGPVLSHAALATAPSGDVDAVLPLAERIRQLEAAVRQASGRGGASAAAALTRWLRELFAALPLGVAVAGPAGELAWWNRRLEEMACLGPGRAPPGPGGRVEAEGAAPGAERVELPGEVLRLLAVDGEHTLTVAGRPATWRVTSATLAASAGLPGGRVVVLEDLTERRTLEAKLTHQDRLASVGRLAAGVAHEIGNPLAGLLMVARNLESERQPEELPQRLGQIVAQAERIDRIVRNLVTYSRSGSPAQVSSPARFALSAVVKAAVELAALNRLRPFEVAQGEDVTVEGREQELVQVLVNLLTNAADASAPEGKVRVAVRAEGRWAVIAVEDEGRGMAEAVRARAFEPFFTTKEPGAGTGLGLSICYSIVTAHGGTIDVASAEGKGTTVTVRLPRVAAPRLG